jgi:hypothetical protein
MSGFSIINPGSHVGGGTEEQALQNARQWLRDMRTNGITDPNIVLVEEPVGSDELRWTFAFRHLLTEVECRLEIHGLTDLEADKPLFPPRVYWKGSSCSTPVALDWMAPGYVLAIIPEGSAPDD